MKHSTHLEELSTPSLVQLLLDEEAKVPRVVAAAADSIALAVERASDCLRKGGRLLYLGAGSSGRLVAADAAECVATFGVNRATVRAIVAGGDRALADPNPAAEDNRHEAVLELRRLGLSEADFVLGVTASGTTPFTLAGLQEALDANCATACISSSRNESAQPDGTITIHLPVGEEVLRGSTRLKAGTAAKIALGTFSTAVMIRQGLTRGSDMVNLSPTNSKLRTRAAEIVQRQAHCSRPVAQYILNTFGGNVVRALDRLEEGTMDTFALGVHPAPFGEPVSGPSRDYCVGIDAGGTQVKVAIGRGTAGPDDEPRTSSGGSANLSTDPAGALEAIHRAVADARRGAGCPDGPLGAACIGAAGAGSEQMAGLLRDWATHNLSPNVEVTNDAQPLLWSLGSAGTRVGLLSGTGSFALGIDSNGQVARAGGWGWRFGEPGSGYSIARAALSEIATRTDEGAGLSPLTRALLEHWHADDTAELRVMLNRLDLAPSELASAARVVLDTAAAGDPEARSLTEAAADELARIALQVIRRLGTEGGVEIAAAGGVLSGSPAFRQRVEERLRAWVPEFSGEVQRVTPSRVLFDRARAMLKP